MERNFDYDAVHATGAQRIARIAAESGVPRFVHVSHLNASHNSPSKFYRSKAKGDELVKEAFSAATIVRPAAMYGYEDKLLNNMAGEILVAVHRPSDVPMICLMLILLAIQIVWPIWWKLNNMETRIRPVHVSLMKVFFILILAMNKRCKGHGRHPSSDKYHLHSLPTGVI